MKSGRQVASKLVLLIIVEHKKIFYTKQVLQAQMSRCSCPMQTERKKEKVAWGAAAVGRKDTHYGGMSVTKLEIKLSPS